MKIIYNLDTKEFLSLEGRVVVVDTNDDPGYNGYLSPQVADAIGFPVTEIKVEDSQGFYTGYSSSEPDAPIKPVPAVVPLPLSLLGNRMTVKEVAERLGIKESKLRYEMTLDHAWQGAPIIQDGHRLYFDRADIERIAQSKENN